MVVWSTTISSSISSGMSLSSLTMLAKTSLGCTRMRFLRRPDRGVTADLRRGGMTGMKNELEKKGRGGGQKANWEDFLLLISHGRTSANTFGMSRSVIFYSILFKLFTYIRHLIRFGYLDCHVVSKFASILLCLLDLFVKRSLEPEFVDCLRDEGPDRSLTGL